ncbi:M67 family metallopeptidase [Acidovorax sp. NCPPB 3576]|uniref:M67 family metallopeptidase n=1 Tax=Acidovorax sp. NCPPB 3576 TaxID=2940488 RepID=UPI002349C849|nr:M67 family metallopeptidase [Acidovorax sp. NCPPB 3576]WCM86556.1 M67 family metallopeptidase [Acidovorax sp. NCPPB 3576]
MLLLSHELADAMVRHALAHHPVEACGLIAGPPGGAPVRLVPLRNASNATDAFRFDSREQLSVWRELDERGEMPHVLYHSHTASRAYPSRDDVAFAADPATHYLIVSTVDPQSPEMRSFRIVSGRITEEALVISDCPPR